MPTVTISAEKVVLFCQIEEFLNKETTVSGVNPLVCFGSLLIQLKSKAKG